MGRDSEEFIYKLHEIVNKNGQTSGNGSPVVEWDSQGKGFLVHNLVEFTNQVLFPQCGISRLESFARKVPSCDILAQ